MLEFSPHSSRSRGSRSCVTLAPPDGMSIEEAAVFRGAHHTAYHALLQRGPMQAGDWVLIHGGAGRIGITAIQVAKLFGATVIATASTDEKRAACLEEGADFAIDYRGWF